MQIHRMLDIVHILLRRDKVTAKELAERFEVSQRTIYRDIEALAGANIPVACDRGKGGGIRLMPGFALNRSLLTEKEQDEVLSALESMRAADTPEAQSAFDKLSTLFQRDGSNWISVDFSDWSGSDARFALLKGAILGKRRVRFSYFGSNGEKTVRTAEPLQMWFRHWNWYLKAFCLERNAMRVFKYVRMREIEVLDEVFERELPVNWTPNGMDVPPPSIVLKMRIDASQAYRVYDEFDESSIEQQADGSFTASGWYVMDSWVLSFILSFGEHAEVIQPGWLRGLIAWRLRTGAEKYLADET